MKLTDPFALIVRDDGVTLKLVGTVDGETVPLPPAVTVIVMVPCPPCFEIESTAGLIVGKQGAGFGVGKGLGVGVGVGLQFTPLFPQGVGEGVGVG